MSEIKERPILMSAPMVLATFAGTKTQTRRTTGLDDVNKNPGIWESNGIFTSDGFGELGYMAKKSAKGKPGATFKTNKLEDRTINVCPQVFPYGKPGDRLWVRETWASDVAWDKIAPAKFAHDYGTNLWFAADGNSVNGSSGMSLIRRGKWRPSIFMPRWASRITLEITDVRVERLQDISDEDCIAEGIEPVAQLGIVRACGWKDYSGKTVGFLYPRDSYKSLWESINGAESWDRNNFVWVLTFNRIGL